jgi:LytS/YehU family sensor histidine kinase
MSSQNGSIGLKNVKKRLQLLYPGSHKLNIVSEPETFTVFMVIQLHPSTVSKADEKEIKQPANYALA